MSSLENLSDQLESIAIDLRLAHQVMSQSFIKAPTETEMAARDLALSCIAQGAWQLTKFAIRIERAEEAADRASGLED